jgi:hypothetical protein
VGIKAVAENRLDQQINVSPEKFGRWYPISFAQADAHRQMISFLHVDKRAKN